MTVLSTNYATIDEAWGVPFFEQKKKKKSPRVQDPPMNQNNKSNTNDTIDANDTIDTTDPICELYSSKLGNYTEQDLVKYANEQYNKIPFQRTMKPQSMTQEALDKKVSREPLSKSEYEKQFDVYLPNMYDDIDEASYEPILKPNKVDNSASSNNSNIKKDENMENKKKMDMMETSYQNYEKMRMMRENTKETNKLDILLFIISGILLIFLMEQFIKIGMLIAKHSS